MIDAKLMQKAMEKWGSELQMDLAQEECAELIEAIAHYRRGRPDSFEKMVEEIADVKLMVYQLEILFGQSEVDRVVNEKMIRLASRIEANAFNDY